VDEAAKQEGEITFYDSVTGRPLFIAPRGRSLKSFVKESNAAIDAMVSTAPKTKYRPSTSSFASRRSSM